MVKNVPMEDPGHLVIDLQHQFIRQGKVPHLDIGIPAHHFVMVAGDIEDPGAVGDQLDDLLDDHYMGNGKVSLGKLPAVNDISIEDQHVRSNASEVVDQFLRPAAVGSEMNIRYHNY